MRLVKKIIHGIAWRARRVIGRMHKCYTLKFRYPAIYQKESRKPVKEKAVFLERRGVQLSDNFELVYEELKKRGDIELVSCFIGEGRLGRWEQWKNNAAFIKEIATAKYVFINDSTTLVSCIEPRPETKIVQLWHACGAFKKFGYSTADKIFGGSRKELEQFPLHKNFSLVTVSSPEVIWAYAEAFHMEDKKENIVAAGISRTDVFFDKGKIQAAYEKVHQLVPQSCNKKIILYAPTFRGRVACAESPDKMNLVKMKKALGDEYVILNKHHPFVKQRPEISKEVQDFSIDVTDILTIEELLMVSDICISDYSSLIFEYSLFERPMLFFAYDLDEYFDWRGFYYDYSEMTPGPVCKTTEDIIDYIENLKTKFDRQKIVDFREKFMSSCDGKSTQRILEMVLGN
ncbi:MAG: CDP-glycerol glycerophosphotransferase family protein [Eubacteriales bacterium]|nr:CDP-glycerol glycerophosphotransferase family protein [Eubacteriales bacterium]